MAKAKKKGELARIRGVKVTPARIRKVYGQKRIVGHYDRPRILSYGGGVDSFAMLVAALERGEPPTDVVFADMTDPRSVTRMLRGQEPIWEKGESPGEWPGTYRHLVEVAIPLMERHGIPFHWLTTEDPTRGWPWREYARTYPILGGERTFGENKPYTSLYRYFEDMQIMFTTSHMGGRVCTNAAKWLPTLAGTRAAVRGTLYQSFIDRSVVLVFDSLETITLSSCLMMYPEEVIEEVAEALGDADHQLICWLAF